MSKTKNKDGVLDLSQNVVEDAVVNNGQLTEDEIGAVRNIRNRSTEITLKLGQLRLEQIRVQSRLAQVNNSETELIEEYGRLVQQEQDTFSSISEKYGQGELNLETGTFTPAE